MRSWVSELFTLGSEFHVLHLADVTEGKFHVPFEPYLFICLTCVLDTLEVVPTIPASWFTIALLLSVGRT